MRKESVLDYKEGPNLIISAFESRGLSRLEAEER